MTPIFDFTFGDVLDHLADRIIVRPVIFVQRGFDIFLCGDTDRYLRFQEVVQGVNCVQIRRVATATVTLLP